MQELSIKEQKAVNGGAYWIRLALYALANASSGHYAEGVSDGQRQIGSGRPVVVRDF